MTHTTPDLDQQHAPYAQSLAEFAKAPWLRLNVPGHAADPATFGDLAGFAGLGSMQQDVPPLLDGIDLGVDSPMVAAHRLAAAAWGARRTWLLTNGASQANRIASMALGCLGDDIVIQRSVHSSVVDGLIFSGMYASFVMPSVDYDQGIAHGVTPATLAAVLDNNRDAVAAYVVTPSYFGAVADVEGLARVAHAAGVPLVVDEAWGAHFGFHPRLPQNSLTRGADLVISSTHKMGGSLTQSAMLHLADGPWGAELEPLLERGFRLTQSTSESALLLGSLDLARRHLVTNTDAIGASIDAGDQIRAAVRERGRYRIISDGFDAFDDIAAADPLRVSIDTRAGGISGHQARWQLMQDHQILVEVATDAAIVAVIGAGAAPDVDRFVDALHSLPISSDPESGSDRLQLPLPGESRMSPREAYFLPSRQIAAEQAVGRVSAETLAAYPPGIPNVLPGEVITPELVAFLQQTAATPGGHVRGCTDPTIQTLRVIDRHSPSHG